MSVQRAGIGSTVRRRLRRMPLHITAAVIVVVCLFPVYWMVATAFKPNRDIQSTSPQLLPRTWTLETCPSTCPAFCRV